MPVSYSQDVLRHWSCKCSEGEALAFRTHLAMSGLELPEVVDAWAVIDGEADVAGSDVAAWQHVVSACVKAENDGLSPRGKLEFNNVVKDLAVVVSTLNVREAAGWVDAVDSVPEVVAEVSAPNPPEVAEVAQPSIESSPVEPPAEMQIEQVSSLPSDNVNVDEVKQESPATDSAQNSEASE